MRATDDHMENAGLAGSESVGYAAGRSQQRHTKDKVVTVRMTTDDAGDLAYVREQLGSGSGPEAVRETVRIAAAVLRGEQYQASRTRHDALRVDVPEEVMVSVRGALQANADSHSDVAFQFQKIGNNVNQLARVANAGDRVPAEALAGVQRALERIEYRLNRDAHRDGDRAAKMWRAL